MKKILLVLTIFFVFLFGLTIGGNFNTSSSELFEESKDKFEEEIIKENNDYNNENFELVPNDNSINKIAKKAENIIDSIIDKIFSALS